MVQRLGVSPLLGQNSVMVNATSHLSFTATSTAGGEFQLRMVMPMQAKLGLLTVLAQTPMPLWHE